MFSINRTGGGGDTHVFHSWSYQHNIDDGQAMERLRRQSRSTRLFVRMRVKRVAMISRQPKTTTGWPGLVYLPISSFFDQYDQTSAFGEDMIVFISKSLRRTKCHHGGATGGFESYSDNG